VGVEYRLNKEAFEKMPLTITKSPQEIEKELGRMMELLLIFEVMVWERLFWDKFNFFLDQIGDDRVEEKKRLTREWKANCWKRLVPPMHAAVKRFADVDMPVTDKVILQENVGKQWGSYNGQLFEGVEKP
jgi:hypothetical protein